MALRVLPSECVAEGPGLTGKFTAQQVRTSFTIAACGRGGQRATAGGETFRVKVRGQGSVDPAVTDKKDGTYLVELTYPISGKYEALVSLGFDPIKGSPFTVVVQSARRPPAPPPPRFGAAAAGFTVSATGPQLEWDPPEHTGGMPLTGYTVYAVRGGDGKSPMAQLGPNTRSCAVPTAAGGAASALYYGFSVSATNEKGEGERSLPGPRPAPFDSSRFDAERAALLSIFAKHASPTAAADGAPGVAVETYCGRASASGELAMVAASYGEGASIVGTTLDRLRRAAAAWEEAGGEPGELAAISADVEGATAHEIGVAMLLHVWDVLVPGGKGLDARALEQIGGACDRRSFLACVEGDPRGATLLGELPELAEALKVHAAEAPQKPLTRQEVLVVAKRGLPRLPIELRAAKLTEAREAAAAAEAAERARREAAEAAERARREAEERRRQQAATRIQACARGMAARRAAAAERARREEEERARLAAEEAARRAAAEAAAATTIQRMWRGRAGRARARRAHEARAAEVARRLALHAESRQRVRQCLAESDAAAWEEERAGRLRRAASAKAVLEAQTRAEAEAEAKAVAAAKAAAAAKGAAKAEEEVRAARVAWEEQAATEADAAAKAAVAEAAAAAKMEEERERALVAIDDERGQLLNESKELRLGRVGSRRRLLTLQSDAAASTAAADAATGAADAAGGELEAWQKRAAAARDGERAAEEEWAALRKKGAEAKLAAEQSAVALGAIASAEAEAIGEFEAAKETVAKRDAAAREELVTARAEEQRATAATKDVERAAAELEEACVKLQRELDMRRAKRAGADKRHTEATAELRRRVEELEAQKGTVLVAREEAGAGEEVLRRAAEEAEAEWKPRSLEVAAMARLLKAECDKREAELGKLRQEVAKSAAAARRAAVGARAAEAALPALRQQLKQQQATRAGLEAAAEAAVTAAAAAEAAAGKERDAAAAEARSVEADAAAAKREQARGAQAMATQVAASRGASQSAERKVQREATAAALARAREAFKSMWAEAGEAEAARCAQLLRAVPVARATASEVALAKFEEEATAAATGAPALTAAEAAAAGKAAAAAAAAADEGARLLRQAKEAALEEAEEARREAAVAAAAEGERGGAEEDGGDEEMATGGSGGVGGGSWLATEAAVAATAAAAARGVAGGMPSERGWQSGSVRGAGLDLPSGVRLVTTDGSRWVVAIKQVPTPGGGVAADVFACTVGDGPARGVVHCCEELSFLCGSQQWRARIADAPLSFELRRCDALAAAEQGAAPRRSTTLEYTDWQGQLREWALPAHVAWCANLPPARSSGRHGGDNDGYPVVVGVPQLVPLPAPLPPLPPIPGHSAAASAVSRGLQGVEPPLAKPIAPWRAALAAAAGPPNFENASG